MRVVCGLAVVLLFVPGACRSSDTIDATRAEVACVGGVKVSPGSAALHAGDTLRASAEVPRCDPSFNTPFRWRSSNTTVAVVDSLSGLVRALSLGSTSIIGSLVTDRTLSGSMTLVVAP